MKGVVGIRVSAVVLLCFSKCVAQYAPDPGFCKMVAQCHEPPSSSTPPSSQPPSGSEATPTTKTNDPVDREKSSKVTDDPATKDPTTTNDPNDPASTPTTEPQPPTGGTVQTTSIPTTPTNEPTTDLPEKPRPGTPLPPSERPSPPSDRPSPPSNEPTPPLEQPSPPPMPPTDSPPSSPGTTTKPFLDRPTSQPGTTGRPRPPSPGHLVEDPNGHLRCRQVTEEPPNRLQQQPGSGSHENPTSVPGSYHGRIPCSSPRKQKPCLGALNRKWDYATLQWSEAYPRSGWPEPWVLPSAAYADGPKILEIVDWQYQTSHYRIIVDNVVVDESDEEGHQNEDLRCDQPDICIDTGFGRAFAYVPQTSSKVVVENTAGHKVFSSGIAHAYEQFAWRLWEPCQC